jgi:hypothetical protein
MPTPEEEKFLFAFTQYVDFRISRGVEAPPEPFGDRLVFAFTEFLKSRGPEAGETFDFLIDKMVKMAESRGGTQPPPRPANRPT